MSMTDEERSTQVTEQDIADSVELVRQFIGAIEKLINEK